MADCWMKKNNTTLRVHFWNLAALGFLSVIVIYNQLVPRDINKMADDELLDLRFRDLPIRIQGTYLEDRVERLYGELEVRGLRFRPHVWLSAEWFSPDGVGGFAIPFYLANQRLMNLERRQMLEVEGASEGEC